MIEGSVKNASFRVESSERVGISRCWHARFYAIETSRRVVVQGSRPTSRRAFSSTIGWWNFAIRYSKAGFAIDPEILGFDFVAKPDDLDEGEFLTGGEAWFKCRHGLADPMSFGVDGFPDNFGIGEIRGNLIRDLAALNKVETLPWDEWGRMAKSYAGETGPDFDELMDIVATTCASNDEHAITALYASHDFTVPPNLQ